MRAVVHDTYGPPDVQRIEEVERPVPNADEVLIRIRATTVNRSDTGFLSPELAIVRLFAGVRRPRHRILGTELAGEVAAVGATVTEFKVGDHVFGIKPWKFGAHAEFICMRASATLALKPAGITFEEAAVVCDGGLLALMNLRAARVRAGQSVLVYGASGSIGTAGVQLAKYFGARVTAVCNTKNLALVKSLGADEVIDYTQEDFAENGQTYDIIFDAVGKRSFTQCRASLKPGGIYIGTDGFGNLARALSPVRLGDKRVVMVIPPKYLQRDVVFLKELIEAGKYHAVIDRTYPLDEVVEATKYVETKQKTGNVVLTLNGGA
jgi:NADPH:quinone reductase-like Zn-dependent oxidoreductase